jgi:hypothetical protein
LAILGISRNGLGDRWHILARTEKKPAKICQPLGISLCDVPDMPTVSPTIARSATVGKLDAESYQNPPAGESDFTSMDV